MNWYDADEYCANKGGFLAEPMTSEENNFLLGYAPSLGNVNWWTGNLPTLDSGIGVALGINVAPGTFVKNIKHRP